MLLSDFAFKNPDWNRVLKQWHKNSVQLEPFNSAKTYHRQTVLKSLADKPKDGLSFLTKTYKDGTKTRRVATGILQSKDKPDKLIAKYMVGNPRSAVDKRFKGALESLDQRVGKRKIEIDGINPATQELYDKKFKGRLT